MFAREEIQAWEEEQLQLDGGFTKKHKDPRREKLRDVRKGIKSVHFDKECTSVKKDYRRLYRTKMKQLMRIGNYELLHDYKRTSGWITW